MDSLTHIVIGACIGEALAGKRLGKKAMLLGALAQNIPDIDIVTSFWMNPSADLLAHRGFTHSFLFAILVSLLLALLSKRWQRKTDLPFGSWMLFWGSQVFVHIFIDAFNAYGTGWFEPFSHYRVSFNTIFVADPLFTIWPLIASIVLLVLKKNDAKRLRWAKFGLLMSALYLVCCVCNKLVVNKAVQENIAAQHITCKRYMTTPTPLNSLLWYVVAESDSGYYTGYRSVFDKKKPFALAYVYRNDSLLQTITDRKEVSQLMRFSQGYYTFEKWQDTLVFNDLRFGRITGWRTDKTGFVFSYYLQRPGANDMVIQRGRLADFSKKGFYSLWERIKGN